ncbi:MAG: NPCBM/NEW2 domain-containing protein, partial [Planctomycetes bacterium]|nr:NPCBM/NEW2 domain-containing protein [Planctomycetota bacterium]
MSLLPTPANRATAICYLAIFNLQFAILNLQSSPVAQAAAPDHDNEIQLAHQWADAALAKPRRTKGQTPPLPTDALFVVRKSHLVLTNRTPWGTPPTLGDRKYEHGVYMDAPAAVRVHLSRPATRFTATVGIDNNRSTQAKPEGGSARFHVVVGGDRVFSSDVLKLDTRPLAVDVPLGGCKEFLLEVDDGGNGRGWDQCTWADAAVKLDDGSTLRLDELSKVDASPWQENYSTAPFSFTYGGKPSHDLLPEWEYESVTEPAEGGSRRVVSYTCPTTGLVLECHLRTFAGAPGIDWVFYLSNSGTADTPIIEQFMPLDTTNLLEAADSQGPITLRWSNGDGCSAESFLPHDEPLEPGRSRQFQGSSSDTSCFPFFNLKVPGGGWVLAVGWSGHWMADFVKHAAGQLAARAGMRTTYFRLKPGERVRSPRILLMRYLGEEMIDGHNRFRRLMLSHYVQRRDGKPAEPPVAHNSTAGLYVRAKRDKKPLATL